MQVLMEHRLTTAVRTSEALPALLAEVGAGKGPGKQATSWWYERCATSGSVRGVSPIFTPLPLSVSILRLIFEAHSQSSDAHQLLALNMGWPLDSAE